MIKRCKGKPQDWLVVVLLIPVFSCNALNALDTVVNIQSHNLNDLTVTC